MKTWMIVAVLAAAGTVVRAEDKPPTEAEAQTEAFRVATEKLKAKGAIAPASPADDIESLKLENAALRQRVAELEAMLGLKVKSVSPRQAKTYTTFQDVINAVNYPADPHKEWTELQRNKAQHDLDAAVIGSMFQATMKLQEATATKTGFSCTFSRGTGGKTEGLSGTFDARYSDLITSWKVGQSISFVGVIKYSKLYQSKGGGLSVEIRLADCVPK